MHALSGSLSETHGEERGSSLLQTLTERAPIITSVSALVCARLWALPTVVSSRRSHYLPCATKRRTSRCFRRARPLARCAHCNGPRPGIERQLLHSLGGDARSAAASPRVLVTKLALIPCAQISFMSQEEYLQTVASRVLYSRSCGAFYLSLLVASLTEIIWIAHPWVPTFPARASSHLSHPHISHFTPP